MQIFFSQRASNKRSNPLSRSAFLHFATPALRERERKREPVTKDYVYGKTQFTKLAISRDFSWATGHAGGDEAKFPRGRRTFDVGRTRRKDYNVARSIALETQQFVVARPGPRKRIYLYQGGTSRNGRDLPRLCPFSVSTLSVPTKILPPWAKRRRDLPFPRSKTRRQEPRTKVRYFRVKFCEMLPRLLYLLWMDFKIIVKLSTCNS